MERVNNFTFIGDCIRPDPDGSFGLINDTTCWLHDILSAPIKLATNLASNRLIQDKFNGVDPSPFFETTPSDETSRRWAEACRCEKHLAVLKSIYSQHIDRESLYIGFELPPVTRRAFRELGATYVDFWIHPIRYLDDLLLGAGSNCPEIHRKLNEHAICEQEVQITSGLRKASLGRWPRAKLPNNTLLVAGQVRHDKSQVMEDGSFFDANMHREAVARTLDQYDCILTIAHPLDPAHSLLDLVKELRPDAIQVSDNIYYLMSQDSVKGLLTVNSSCAEEARYFGVQVHTLLPPICEFAYRQVIPQVATLPNERYVSLAADELLQPAFWRSVLCHLADVTPEDGWRLQARPNRLRRSLRAFWAFQGFDSDILHNPMNPKLAMPSSPIEVGEASFVLGAMQLGSGAQIGKHGWVQIQGKAGELTGPHWSLGSGSYEFHIYSSDHISSSIDVQLFHTGVHGRVDIEQHSVAIEQLDGSRLRTCICFDIQSDVQDFQISFSANSKSTIEIRSVVLRLAAKKPIAPRKTDVMMTSKISKSKDYSYLSGERQVAPSLEQIRFDHRARYQLACDLLKQHFPPGAEIRGVDAFCGNGYGTYMLATQLGCRCLGIDGSKEAIEFGNLHYALPSVAFEHRLFPFELPKAHYDFATCFESIEHVQDDQGLLQTIAAAVRPGGLVFVSTPNEEVLSLSKNPHPFHYRHYRPIELLDLCPEIGLNPIGCFGQDAYEMDCSGKQGASLSEEKMGLKPDYAGQFQVHIFGVEGASGMGFRSSGATGGSGKSSKAGLKSFRKTG